MNNKVTPGVVLVSKFVKPHSKAFSGYIEYIDRDKAVRNEYDTEWNDYVDYMGNPEKTSELFTAGADQLTDLEKENLKEAFKAGEERENLMWQTVISFDNSWLSEEGLYEPDSGYLDAGKLKELTRNCMEIMLKKEGIDQSAIWSAAIHYNTDNIHIHIATIEPGQTLRPMRHDGEPKGVWKQSSLDQGKSAVINGILMQQQENTYINDLMRKSIIGGKKEKRIAYDKDLRDTFIKVYQNLPENKRYWNYNSTNLGNRTREYLDELSKLYIQKYHQEDFNELMKAADIMQEKYIRAYGSGSKADQFSKNKEKELYQRLGNTILKEMKVYDQELKESEHLINRSERTLAHYKLQHQFGSRTMQNPDCKTTFTKITSAMNRINKAMKKDLQSMKNLSEYERLQQQIEMHKADINPYS